MWRQKKHGCWLADRSFVIKMYHEISLCWVFSAEWWRCRSCWSCRRTLRFSDVLLGTESLKPVLMCPNQFASWSSTEICFFWRDVSDGRSGELGLTSNSGGSQLFRYDDTSELQRKSVSQTLFKLIKHNKKPVRAAEPAEAWRLLVLNEANSLRSLCFHAGCTNKAQK